MNKKIAWILIPAVLVISAYGLQSALAQSVKTNAQANSVTEVSQNAIRTILETFSDCSQSQNNFANATFDPKVQQATFYTVGEPTAQLVKLTAKLPETVEVNFSYAKFTWCQMESSVKAAIVAGKTAGVVLASPTLNGEGIVVQSNRQLSHTEAKNLQSLLENSGGVETSVEVKAEAVNIVPAVESN